MSGVNPVILIQLLMQYHNTPAEARARSFVFNKNYRLRVHKETPDELKRRKSNLSLSTVTYSEEAIRDLLKKQLHGRIGKVWIDPALDKIAVPLQMSTGETGYGVLSTGSRIKIPEGQFVRAFTYWEKVNDIDLACFALTEDGRQQEFSWRNMYRNQGDDICFSGDQTSGYNGGSEYFDISIEKFAKSHPTYRYIVFTNNVYSGINFAECTCKAGFMIREENPRDVPMWKGERSDSESIGLIRRSEIFDPATVQTSFRINAESMFAYLFAIDLQKREMVWLNMARKDGIRVAGTTDMDFLLRYMTIVDAFNMRDLYEWSGTPVDDITDAEVIVTDRMFETFDNAEVVHSWDFEKMLRLLQPSA